jgi:hypothetical protein
MVGQDDPYSPHHFAAYSTLNAVTEKGPNFDLKNQTHTLNLFILTNFVFEMDFLLILLAI